MFVTSVGKLTPEYTASHPNRRNFSVKQMFQASLNIENKLLIPFIHCYRNNAVCFCTLEQGLTGLRYMFL